MKLVKQKRRSEAQRNSNANNEKKKDAKLLPERGREKKEEESFENILRIFYLHIY